MKLLESMSVSIDEEHESMGSKTTFPAGLREGENIREEEQRKGEEEGTLEEENVSIGYIREGSNNMGDEIRREGISLVEDVSIKEGLREGEDNREKGEGEGTL